MKRESGIVYICSSDGYSEMVAERLGNSDIKYRFSVPDGETLVLYSGALLKFTSGFSFRYLADHTVTYTDGDFTEKDTDGMRKLTPGGVETAETAVREFLEKGSSGFDEQDQLNIVTEIRAVYEKKDVYYVECVRTIDGMEITGNRVVCVVKDGTVAEAVGNWCFLTIGESYSAQLTDVLNILFNVRKEIAGIREEGSSPAAVVERISRCYTLYYLGDDVGFCLIPCWQIVTDIYGEFIYNALDGTLYTKK